MNAFAILGVAWMVAVVLGIWTIAILLFISRHRVPSEADTDQWIARAARKQLEREGCVFEDAHLGAKESV